MQDSLKAALLCLAARTKRQATLEEALIPLQLRASREAALLSELEKRHSVALAEEKRFAWAVALVEELADVKIQLAVASEEERPLMLAQLHFLEQRSSRTGAAKAFQEILARRARRVQDAYLGESLLTDVRHRRAALSEAESDLERGGSSVANAARFVEVCLCFWGKSHQCFIIIGLLLFLCIADGNSPTEGEFDGSRTFTFGGLTGGEQTP